MPSPKSHAYDVMPEGLVESAPLKKTFWPAAGAAGETVNLAASGPAGEPAGGEAWE